MGFICINHFSERQFAIFLVATNFQYFLSYTEVWICFYTSHEPWFFPTFVCLLYWILLKILLLLWVLSKIIYLYSSVKSNQKLTYFSRKPSNNRNFNTCMRNRAWVWIWSSSCNFCIKHKLVSPPCYCWENSFYSK